MGYEAQMHEEDNDMEEEATPLHQSIAKEPPREMEQHIRMPKVMQSLPIISPSFPQGQKKKNEDEKFKNFLSVFKTLSINLPLMEELLEMPGYAKFMKELVTKKRSLDFETIEVSHSCSATMTNEMIKKREDPKHLPSLTLLTCSNLLKPNVIWKHLMPYAIYKQLGLGEPKATTMRLLMADRSIKYHVGILYAIFVKVERFIFSDDFVILNCEINVEIPIILGRTFLATKRPLVDVESGELMFRVNEDEVTFNVYKPMKHPSDIHVVSTVDVIDEAVASVKLPLQVLRRHIKAICWTIADIVGIPPDYVSKWVEVVALPNNEGKSVVQFLKRYIFARFGTPRDITSDGGSHFCNKWFSAVLSETQSSNFVSSPNKKPS
ncbi:uncharacterized protein LOC125822175 [Solanum verrucosum]|uniref:uncharacterized protein LOC125822175 n=1 Tax=Solanum verrucosum TaxID=315347 RepID=UPI0020D1F0E7|nr:uncharacterized protein LOC125822175 [Solanum verrucosum]